MTNHQRDALTSCLNSNEIRTALNRVGVQITESDVEACPAYPRVLQLKSRSGPNHIKQYERQFAQAICVREQDDVLLLGNTPAIEGFFLGRKRPIQLKQAGVDSKDPNPPPGGFVQAFLTAWQKPRGWVGIWLYIHAPKITKEWASDRWNDTQRQPQREQIHLNNQIGRVVVNCSNGWAELPLNLPGQT